jgi:hypothetical protein
LPWYGGEDAGLQEEEIPRGARGGEELTRHEAAVVMLAAANPQMPNTEVCRRAGMSDQSSVVKRLGANGDLRQHVRALLAEAGFDDKAIVSKWAQLATAKKTEFFSYQGQVLDQREVEALDIQVKGVDAITKLARLYPVTDEEAAARGAGPPALTIQLNLGAPALVDATVLTVALGSPPIDDGVLDAETGPDRT